jgi:hypothetical protein
MKTLATSIVAIQEVSENLNTGLALANLNGEYFYINDNWPKIISLNPTLTGIRNDADLYPPELIKEIKDTNAEILLKKIPVGYIITDGSDKENHLLLKFTINYTTGEPFCICTLAKKIEGADHCNELMEKIKEAFQLTHDAEFRLLNRESCC